ncbi:chemotaxis protein CheB [soil metagenome]
MPEDPAARAQPDTPAQRPHLVVGLGASAGGIQALRTFFSSVPVGSGAAYVVILHLSPEHDSRLPEVLQASTSMPVVRVSETQPLEPNHVYVISPKMSLRMADGLLTAAEWVSPDERRAPVDIFFRALAEALGPRAVGIVLSGTGADGSSGIRRLREYGGLTIAQEPGEAEHDDMPRSAIAGGLIDYVLPIGEMPRRIAAYAPMAGDGGAPEEDLDSLRDGVREILAILRTRTGHDFSQYKTGTLVRRIERRRHLHDLADLPAYAQFLRSHPDEAGALLQELLISVTNFFRDSAAFDVLESKIVPRMLDVETQRHVRAWVAGCATGEEAYSIAMLLAEAAERHGDPPTIQVFGTDLNARAVASAREAFYTAAEVVDVSPERLRRFFNREAGGYRVRRDLREVVLFAQHNVLRDPPFSHLDLVCCRNLLIYLQRPAQDRVIETFHFALRPGRYLMVGGSESLQADTDLFVSVDKQARIFESRLSTTSRVGQPALALPPRPLPPPSLRGDADKAPSERVSAAHRHLHLLEQVAPPSVVVTEDHHILHTSETAARYLRMGGGEPTRDLLRLVSPQLQGDLRTALYQANRERTTVVARRVPWEDGEGPRLLDIEVRPVLREQDPGRGFFVVLFEEVSSGDASARQPAPREARDTTDESAGHVEQALLRLKGQLRTTIDQYETQVEEAKASNEELQAVNEELRSSAEELETSTEELQSVNEELTTVNQELKIKIDELGARNNDFQNLINSTDIGTLFLDRRFRVKFATPRVRDVFNLLPGDVGRPLSDVTNTLIDDDLYEDIRQVADRLQPVEREIRSRGGQCYLLRILPYRTTDDRIEGTVLTFQDITTRKRAESDVRASEERLRLLIDSVRDYAIFTMEPDGRIASWNSGAQRMFGYAGEEAIGQPVAVLFTPEDREAGVPGVELHRAAREGRAEDARWHLRKDGNRLYCSGVTTPLGDSEAKGFAKIARDLTDSRQAQSALEQAHEMLDARVQERTAELEAEMRVRAAAEMRATDLVRALVATQEDERARVARDLHDQVGQQLTGLRLSLERLQDYCRPDEQAIGEVARALSIAHEIDAELDFLAWELRPAALDDLGLVAAVSRFLQTWSDHVGIKVEFRQARMESYRLDRETETTLYRIVQEALNNVTKHAHASRVDVILELRDTAVVLVVEDDGVGFDTEAPDPGLGLPGMRERAALVGAELHIESTPGQGTTVFVRQSAARAH